MTTYTGVADANGDFVIPFSTNYTGGQKVTVTAEKDSAMKTIELFAPSDVTGGGAIQFSGNLNNFPAAIGTITLAGLTGAVQNNAFRSTRAYGTDDDMFSMATGLIIDEGITSIGSLGFAYWSRAKTLQLPTSLRSIGARAFDSWIELLIMDVPEGVTSIGDSAFRLQSKCTKLILPSTLLSIGGMAIYSSAQLSLIVCNATTPPTLGDNNFLGINASYIIKVPAASVDAYKAAPKWSAHAAKIQAI